MIEKRRLVARFMVLTMFMMMGFAFISNRGISVNHANGSTGTSDITTESSDIGAGDNINDLSVQMNSDGSIDITGIGDGNSASLWSNMFNKYKIFIAGLSGLATLTFVVLFILNFVKVGASSDVPAQRKAAITACLWTGVAAALCGSVLVITGLFWNGLK